MPSGKKRTNRQSYRNDYSRAGRSPAAAAALGLVFILLVLVLVFIVYKSAHLRAGLESGRHGFRAR